ncbi:hypothetical protein DEU42_10296 [Flavobacterium sp. AG291]|nr:hypothetical protein DEU42_10296 [Flavobacterium sp. AG291]
MTLIIISYVFIENAYVIKMTVYIMNYAKPTFLFSIKFIYLLTSLIKHFKNYT